MTPEFTLDPLLIEALAGALLHFLWQGALIALLVYLVLERMRSASANARHLVALAGLALMALAVPVTTLWLWSEAGTGSSMAAAGLGEVERLLVAIAPGAAGLDTWSLWTVCLWLAGALVTATRACLAWLGLWRVRRAADFNVAAELRTLLAELRALMALPDRVRIGLSRAVPGPLVLGWLKPVLLLPPSLVARLPIGQLEMIVAHELAHLRRADHWINLFQVVVETLLFYHPAVGWMSRRVRIERENACDDLVVAVTGRKLEYVEMLAALEHWRRPGPSLALGVGDGQILSRIRRLVERGEPGRARGSVLGLVAALLAALGLGSAPLLEHWLPDPSSPAIAPAPVDPQPVSTTAAAKPPESAVSRPETSTRRLVRETSSDPADITFIDTPPARSAPEPGAETASPPASRAEAVASVNRVSPPAAPEPTPEPAPAPTTTPRAQTDLVADAQVPEPSPTPVLPTDMLPTDMLLAANLPTPAALADRERESAPATAPVGALAREAVTTGGALLRRTEPEYPRRALVRRIDGVVEVELEIAADGSVDAVSVVSEAPNGYGFGKAAAQAARQWRFEPFRRDGEPVDHRGRVEIQFQPGDGCAVPTGTRIRSC